MSAIANIVVPDAASTPVNHTFAPARIDGNVGRWQERTAAVPAGYWSLSSGLRAPVAGSAVYRQTLDLAIPSLKTYTDLSGNSITVVDYVHRFKGEFLLPDRGTLQNRKDIRKLMTGIYADSQLIDQVENLGNSF